MKEWKEGRKEFLACNPQCYICGANATEVHHDFSAGYYYWTDEDFFNREYWMPICKECHAKISSENRRLSKGRYKY